MSEFNPQNETNQDTAGQEEKKKGWGKEAWEWGKSLLVAFLLALLIRQFAFAIFMVDGQSMVPTLEDQERLVVNKMVYYLHKPERDDIVVFKFPADPSKDFIKRVIGVPGDKIEIRDYKVFRNGEELSEDYIAEPTATNNGVFTVPDGTIFVLGDNRNYSKDSRDPQVGYVPYDAVIGRAEFVWWPFDQFRDI